MSAPAAATVCIPTRNRSALVARAIRSVLAQRFDNLAVLVSDNASDDNTEAVVRAVQDPRLRYVRHRSNIGPGPNFNACLQAADTEFVSVLCDDDVLHPDFLAAGVEALRSSPKAGFAYSTWRRRRDDGTVEDRVIDQTGLPSTTVLPGRAFVERAIRQTSVAHTSGVLMRRAAIPLDGFDLRDSYAMDVGLLLRMAARWDVVFLPQPLVHVRQEADSLTGRIIGVGDDGQIAWDVDAEATRREVRLRFLDGPGRDLAEAPRLRRAVNRYFRCRVMWYSASVLRHGRHLRGARQALRDGIAVDRGVVLDPYAWRSGLAVLAGPTLTNLVGGARR